MAACTFNEGNNCKRQIGFCEGRFQIAKVELKP